MTLFIGGNLSVIGVQAISVIYSKCKLCFKKHKAKKLMQKRLKEMEMKKTVATSAISNHYAIVEDY